MLTYINELDKIKEERAQLAKEREEFKLEKEGRGEGLKDDDGDEPSIANTPEELIYGKDQMKQIMGDIDMAQILKEAEMEYYNEMPP